MRHSIDKSLQNITNVIKNKIGIRSLVLVGMMGSGKSTMGHYISNILDMKFYDSDILIQNFYNMNIIDFFLKYGEKKFRILEETIICSLLENYQGIISTGGGAFTNLKVRNYIRKYGISIFLNSNIVTLEARLHNINNRPLLNTGKNPRKILESLMQERYYIYKKSDIIITSDNVSNDITAYNIMQELNKYFDT